MEEKIMLGTRRYEVHDMSTDSEKISNIFSDYFKSNLFKVNRKYQRKLVWTLQEKKDFIDSLLNEYPVPLFIFARRRDYENGEREIVDGLQRLDALFSFMKNEFSVMWEGKEQYFNIRALNYFPDEITQKEPAMDAKFCRDFGEVELPTTTKTVDDETVIEKIFKRLNSTGRELSNQDLRQAGAVGEFSDIVRKTAAEIRGDVSNKDILDIDEMHKISINNDKLNYGIKMNKLFWIKHDIITPADIRKSRDEELLAQMFCYALGGRDSGASASILDSLYDSSNKYYKVFKALIVKRGQLAWIDDFKSTFKQLERILDANNITFSKLLFDKRDVRGKNKIFLSLFLAMWELKNEHRIFRDPVEVKDVLYHACTNKHRLNDAEIKIFEEVLKGNKWNRESRNTLIDFFKEILLPTTIEVDSGDHFSPVNNALSVMLNEASKVKCENFSLEFKLGLHTLENGVFNKGVIRDVVKTYTAMNNLKLDTPCYIVLGIADNAESAEDYSQAYDCSYTGYGGCFVTGLDMEIKKFCNDQPDQFVRKIVEIVEKCPVDPLIKKHITNSLEFKEYCGRTVLTIECNWSGVLYKYNNTFYSRHGSTTTEVDLTSEEYFEMLKGEDYKMLKSI